MITEHIRTYKRGDWEVKIEFVDWCEGSPWFNDLYTESPHIGGTTIQVPSYLKGNGGYNDRVFYIGQYKPSELARDYAKQGRANSSAEAYASLQKELAHYIQASDCTIQCTIRRCGIKLGEAHSCTFDVSPEYDELDHEGWYKQIVGDYGFDFVHEAVKQARDKLDELCACK